MIERRASRACGRAKFHLGLGSDPGRDDLSALVRRLLNAGGSASLPVGGIWRDPTLMLAVSVLLALFGLLIWHLIFFWEVNPQYSYGWVVPGLVIYLFLRRWESRPAPQPLPCWSGLALILALFVLAPVWLVREATPDWSVVSWLLALTIVSSLLLVLCRLGGTPWLIHFVFPVCFILSAVPWPQRLEIAVVQGLMRFVADAASEILDCIGIPAFATGNLVRVPGVSVAIDEACSGIRSLQAMLMISLFLGGLRNLNVIRRAVLVAFASVAAIVLNLARTAGLVFLFAQKGAAVFNWWHRPTGNALFIAGLILISCLAFLLGRNPERPSQPGSLPSAVLRTTPFASAAILLWLAAIVVGTELWYATNENKFPHTTLEVAWPETLPGYKELAVPDNVRQVLLYSSGRMATWRDGCDWALFAFNWAPGRTATQSARMHRPDTCFQASGAVLDRELDPVTVAMGLTNLSFKSYLFHQSGQPLFVFFTIWEEANLDATSRTLGQDWSGWSRVQRAFGRQRNLGQQSLEFVLSGSENFEDAVGMLKRRLPELIRWRDIE